MKLVCEFLGIKSQEGNIRVEMCSGEFFLKYALAFIIVKSARIPNLLGLLLRCVKEPVTCGP